jgi:hypothetical protein
MRLTFTWLTILLILTHVLPAPMEANAEMPEQFAIGHFSSGAVGETLPAGWQVLAFDKIPKHTQYTSVKDGDRVVIQAQSHASASGLVRKIELDPRVYPIVEWRWKVAGVLKNGDARQKKGDDYAARVYITFAYDPSLLSFVDRIKYNAVKLLYGEYPPTVVLNYVWGNKVPANTRVPSPYTDRSMMVVVQSGDTRAGQWYREERNILLDFREAFNAEPPMISGVAIMTDSDNTGESVTAWYGDIVFRKK